jgi:hypothetical protein
MNYGKRKRAMMLGNGMIERWRNLIVNVKHFVD